MFNIHHVLLINASAERIYDAITLGDGLSAWWTPGAAAKQELNSTAHFPFGANYFKEMNITGLRPYAQVEWLCISGDDEWIGTRICFRLQTITPANITSGFPELKGQLEQQTGFESGTLLMFHHNDWERETPMYAECNYTWAQFLRSLKLLCETGTGRPWPTQHTL